MSKREIGPSDVTYQTGDFVRILTDCYFGWQHDENGYPIGYDKRTKYYEGEIIHLKENEWRELGTMQIRPVNRKEYATHVPAKHRIFSCGVRRRLGYWFSSFFGKIGTALYTCVEVPCAIVSWIAGGIFKLPGFKKIEPFSGIIFFLVLAGVLWSLMH